MTPIQSILSTYRVEYRPLKKTGPNKMKKPVKRGTNKLVENNSGEVNNCINCIYLIIVREEVGGVLGIYECHDSVFNIVTFGCRDTLYGACKDCVLRGTSKDFQLF